MTTTDLEGPGGPVDPMADLRDTAAAAAGEAARTAAVLADAHRLEHEARLADHAAVWQGWADSYDPAALSADVDRADAALREALANTALGRALVAVLTARLRANHLRSLCGKAEGAGARLPAEAVRAHDRRGYESVGDAMEFVGAALGAAAEEVARCTVEAEVAEVTGRAAAALEPPAGGGPVAFRVETAARVTTTTFGDRHVYFEEGRTWLHPGDPLVEGCGRLEGYTVTPLFGPSYADAVALDAAVPRPDDFAGPSPEEPPPPAAELEEPTGEDEA